MTNRRLGAPSRRALPRPTPRAAASLALCSAMALAPAGLLAQPPLAADAHAQQGGGAETPPGPDGSAKVESAPVQPQTSLPLVKVRARRDLLVTQDTDHYGAAAATTATRLALSARETPQSLSVITRARMDDFGLLNANEVLASTPGVSVDVVETDRTYFNSRGFDVSNFQVDGVGMPFTNGDQLGDIDTAPYDRVEVLRGANGLLSSTGNPAATVNYVRKRPTDTFRASAGLTLGSWQKRRAEADLSGPLNQARTLRGRAVVVAQRNESFMDNYALDKRVVAGVVEASLGPRTLVSAGISWQDNRPEGTAWGGLPLNHADGSATTYPRSTAAAPRWSQWHNSDTARFIELSQSLGDAWAVKAVASHRKLRADGKLFSISGGLPDRVTGAGTESWLSTQLADETQTLFDLHATGTVEAAGRRHEVLVGTNIAKVHYDAQYQRGAGNGTPIIAPQGWGSYPEPAFSGGKGSADFLNRRQSAYAMTRLHLADAWKLMLGLNHTRMQSRGLGFRAVPRVYDSAETVPYMGTVLDLDARHSLYASYTKIVNPQTQVDASQALLGPAKGSNIEVGAKGEWLAGLLNGSFAVFRTEQKNTAEYAGFDSSGGFSYYRRVDATSTGFELDVSGRVGAGWELGAGYTQLRLEDAAGAAARTFVPRRALRLSTSYRLPMLPQLKLGATLRWQSEVHRVNATQAAPGGGDIIARQPAYAVLGLMARYDFSDRLSAHMVLNNVSDKTYFASLYWDQSLYGAPRHGQVSLNWKY